LPQIYVATLGQRPEAITVAFDLLGERYRYDAVAVLHTEPNISGIARAFTQLKMVFTRDYPGLSVHFHELTYPDGTPLVDIENQSSAEAYHRGVLEILYKYRERGWQIHLMLAGGRKAMSIYAMLAASLFFDPPHDRVWTVLSPEALIAQEEQFHVPPGMRDQVQLVDLPLRPARIAPGTGVEALVKRPPSRAKAFTDKLTPAEFRVADTLRQNPYAFNDYIAKILGVDKKTIETHFRSIYGKLIGFLDYGESISDKRQALLDVLRGE
jgi:hypothetical protein